MPRNAEGIYSLPAGSTVTPGQTMEASQHNAPIQDLEADANAIRPIGFGGTGANSASGARTALGVPPTANPAFTGTLNGAIAVFSDALSAASGAFAGAISAASGTISGLFTAGRIRITDTTDVSLSSTNHGFQVGLTSGTNIRADGNEIQAVNAGSASNLGLNAEGGNISMTASGGTVFVLGNMTVSEAATFPGGVTGDLSVSGQVSAASISTPIDAIGAIALARYTGGITIRTRGQSVNGVDLNPCSASGEINFVETLSGTWVCLGQMAVGSAGRETSVWQRIS